MFEVILGILKKNRGRQKSSTEGKTDDTRGFRLKAYLARLSRILLVKSMKRMNSYEKGTGFIMAADKRYSVRHKVQWTLRGLPQNNGLRTERLLYTDSA